MNRYALLLKSDQESALVLLAAVTCSAAGMVATRITDELSRREALFAESMGYHNLSQTPLAAAARSIAHDVTMGWLR